MFAYFDEPKVWVKKYAPEPLRSELLYVITQLDFQIAKAINGASYEGALALLMHLNRQRIQMNQALQSYLKTYKPMVSKIEAEVLSESLMEEFFHLCFRRPNAKKLVTEGRVTVRPGEILQVTIHDKEVISMGKKLILRYFDNDIPIMEFICQNSLGINAMSFHPQTGYYEVPIRRIIQRRLAEDQKTVQCREFSGFGTLLNDWFPGCGSK